MIKENKITQEIQHAQVYTVNIKLTKPEHVETIKNYY